MKGRRSLHRKGSMFQVGIVHPFLGLRLDPHEMNTREFCFKHRRLNSSRKEKPPSFKKSNFLFSTTGCGRKRYHLVAEGSEVPLGGRGSFAQHLLLGAGCPGSPSDLGSVIVNPFCFVGDTCPVLCTLTLWCPHLFPQQALQCSCFILCWVLSAVC